MPYDTRACGKKSTANGDARFWCNSEIERTVQGMTDTHRNPGPLLGTTKEMKTPFLALLEPILIPTQGGSEWLSIG